MKGFQLHWDKDYGSQNKIGWSVQIDGHFVADLDSFFVMLWKVARYFMQSGPEKRDLS